MAPSLYLQSCRKVPVIPIIDTHQHIWNLDMFPKDNANPPLDKSYLMKDYIEAVKGQDIVKAVYMEIAVPPELREKEARWALGLCKDPDNPTVAAVIAGDPTDEGFQEYIKAFEGDPHLKGIRYFFRDSDEILLPEVIDNLRLLGEMGLSFDLSLPPGWLHIGRQLLDECPGTRFILNHCGRADPVAFFPDGKEAPRDPRHEPDVWLRGMESLAQRENIICKISGIVSRVPDFPLTALDLAPIINHCIEVFGDDRLIFAGDWPVCLLNMSLANWIETLKEVLADRPREFRLKLFHDNAERFFGLNHN